MTQQVRDFDEHHLQYKQYKYDRSGHICHNIKSSLSPKIKDACTISTEAYNTWEQAFFLKHMREPTADDMEENIRKIYKQMVHAKSLIKQWKN